MSIDRLTITEEGSERGAKSSDPGTKIEELYELRGVADVERALEQSPFLGPLLVQAHQHLRRHFPDSQLYTEVLEDPDGAEEGQLRLYIVTDLPPIQARTRLKAFDAEWWLNALPQAHGKLCISLEFR